MHATRTSHAGPVAGVLLTLVVLAVTACGAAGAATPSPTPTAPASPAPSVPATEAPSPAPSESPAADGIDLDTFDQNDVFVVVDDPDGFLAGAASGRAGDGMSIRWGDVQVENLDEDSLRVTWVGLPVDAEISLEVKAKGDGYVLDFTQPAPPESSDAIGFDRVLVLDFAAPVKAEDVQARFETA
jgi:hypothetical protein